MSGNRSGCALISIKVCDPSASSRCKVVENRTGRRRLSTQYCALSCRPSMACPVTVEYIGIDAEPGRKSASASSKSAHRGSVCELCEATSTLTQRQKIPWFSNCCSKPASVVGSPDNTVDLVLLLTATET